MVLSPHPSHAGRAEGKPALRLSEDMAPGVPGLLPGCLQHTKDSPVPPECLNLGQ